MNLYLVSQEANRDYDTFDSFVIAAPDEETARNTHPNGGIIDWRKADWRSDWAFEPEQVVSKLIGTTETEQGVICASFNAG